MTGETSKKQRDRRQRIVVYGGLALLVGVISVAILVLNRPKPIERDQSWMDVDYQSLREVQLLQEYVRIDTSTTTGSELEGALFLAEKFEEAGIPSHIERLGDGNANMWAILEGRRKEALVLHNHIDVYPVSDLEAWDEPPFSGNLHQAWIYGRGTFDMKSVAIAQLEAMIALKDSGVQPERSVIFLATGSEEIGSELGARWVLQQHPELVDRFWVVLSEGGIVEPVSLEEIKYWGIEFAQKRFANGVVCSRSRERLEELTADVLMLRESTHQTRLTSEVDSFLRQYAESRGPAAFVDALKQIDRALADPREFRTLPPYLQAMFRDEVVAFPIEADPNGGYRMRVLVHLLPGSTQEETVSQLLPDWTVHGVSLTMGPVLGYDGGSPIEHEAFEIQRSAIMDAFPDATVGPYFLPWTATDSRFFREAGAPSYGFSPFVIFNTDTFRVDTSNERLGLPGYVRGIELYQTVVQRLVD